MSKLVHQLVSPSLRLMLYRIAESGDRGRIWQSGIAQKWTAGFGNPA